VSGDFINMGLIMFNGLNKRSF